LWEILEKSEVFGNLPGNAFYLNPRLLDFKPDWLRWSTGFSVGEMKSGHTVGEMKSGTFCSRKATVSHTRCASAPFCWKTKPHPGISGICLAVASWQEEFCDSMSHSLWHPVR